MFVAQLAFSVVVWAFVVVALARKRSALLRRMETVSRGRRVALAFASMLLSFALLALGLFALAQGGMRPGSLTWWGWPAITALGAGFIALQTIGLVPLILNAVTPGPRQSSDNGDSRRP